MDFCPYCKMPPCLTCGKCWCEHEPHAGETREKAEKRVDALHTSEEGK